MPAVDYSKGRTGGRRVQPFPNFEAMIPGCGGATLVNWTGERTAPLGDDPKLDKMIGLLAAGAEGDKRVRDALDKAMGPGGGSVAAVHGSVSDGGSWVDKPLLLVRKGVRSEKDYKALNNWEESELLNFLNKGVRAAICGQGWQYLFTRIGAASRQRIGLG
jgi:hypothetical protein